MASIERVIEIVGEDLEHVERHLRELLSSDVDVTLLRDICSYMLDSGGKRLRPLLLLLAARFCGYTGDQHIPLACVVEYIHTATLLHDDVIDHAEIRRGNSSVNKLWGNHATVLAGDFFLSKAFALAVEADDVRVLAVIARASQCMAEAEIFQASKAGDPLITEAEYFFIVENKTASLMAASACIGGILGGRPEREQKALYDYGFNLGIAFQIMDDVLDYNSREEDFGKTIGKDFQEGSITLPFIAALQRCSAEDRDRMVQIVLKRSRGKRDLAHIIKLIQKYEGSAYATAKARQYVHKAVEALNPFTDGARKSPLIELAEYVVARKF